MQVSNSSHCSCLVAERVESAVQSLKEEFGEHVWVPPSFTVLFHSRDLARFLLKDIMKCNA